MSSANSKKRIEKDVTKLLLSEYDVILRDETKLNDFSVAFYGPKNSPYEDGIWQVNVHLPDQYPYKSPSIGFSNKIFHPNICEASGSVCLDVINQTWSPMYELKNIFDVFLPQLLMYPNPSDPLNSEAAKLLLSDHSKYETAIRDHIKANASKEMIESLKFPNKSNQKKETNKKDKVDDDAMSELSAACLSEDLSEIA